MSTKRVVNLFVLLVCAVGAVYYMATDQEPQGAVVVLLGILYFVALPQV